LDKGEEINEMSNGVDNKVANRAEDNDRIGIDIESGSMP
jgi:hypothetical protein